jgi:small conductance mechanosensitive channel
MSQYLKELKKYMNTGNSSFRERGFSHNDNNEESPSLRQEEKVNIKKSAKESAIGWSVILGACLAIILAVTTYILEPVVPTLYLMYLQVAEVAAVGVFAIYIISKISYSLSLAYSEQTAKSIRSLIRIAGAIIVIAFVISYLSHDPILAASISTISGLVIGFAASNLIGNVIAGIYLAMTRPFRIGDRIKVFDEDGRVSDIGLIHTRLLLDNGDEMLASNSSIVTTNIILRKKERENQEQ